MVTTLSAWSLEPVTVRTEEVAEREEGAVCGDSTQLAQLRQSEAGIGAGRTE